MKRHLTPLADRFWKKVHKTPTCWLWRGAHHDFGYGKIGLGRQDAGTANAHRVSWELHNGPVPKGLSVLHRCDNPPCVRPDHLFLGTQRANLADMTAKGRRVTPSRVGTANGRAKLSEQHVIEILRRRREGESVERLAQAFQVSAPTIYRIVRGVAWSHVR